MEVTKSQLLTWYVVQRLTTTQIAARVGCCPTTVATQLKKYGVTLRSGRDAQVRLIKIPQEELVSYYQRGMSCRAIASICSCSEEAIRRLLIAYRIPRRVKTCNFGGWNRGKQMSEQQRRHLSQQRRELYASGTLKHWNTGGHWSQEVREQISESLLQGRDPAPSDYGPDWRLQRTACLQRDGYLCQQCGSSDGLHVHHWEPYRFCFDNSLDNLVTLCHLCHRELHIRYRREGWISEAEEAFYA